MVSSLALNCTLKPSPQPSSTERLGREVLDALSAEGSEVDMIRVVDFDVRPGVDKDMGDGDQWPGIRSEFWTPTSSCSARPPGSATCRACRSGCWSGSMPN